MVAKNIFILVLVTISSCRDESDRYVGKIHAPISKDIYFKIYQSDKFDYVTAINGEIIDEKGVKIAYRTFLTGTDLIESDTRNFNVFEYDSIIYLTYFDQNEIIGAFDLKTKIGAPFNTTDYKQRESNEDILLSSLRLYNEKLKFWADK